MSHDIVPSPTLPTTGSCCAPSSQTARSADDVRATVREGYAKVALTGAWSAAQPVPAADGCCGSEPAEIPEVAAGGCCGSTRLTPDQVAHAVGYAEADVASLPQGANLGLSCGNPTALASLRAGEVVLDLGAGAGFDCFLAGPRVGAAGRVIGVDITAEMLGRAREALAWYRERSGLDNVEFRLGEIEHLPLADASVDVVISNCVLNLSPDKPQVWREIARVLKPGGRLAISDLALRAPLPAAVAADVEALVGCIAGAAVLDSLRAMVEAAGLTSVRIEAKADYVAAFESAGDPLYARIVSLLPAGATLADFVTSADITATKP